MNKKIYIALLVLVTINLQAQVGINTKNPLGLLHIDIKANNPEGKDPNLSEQVDDMIISIGADDESVLSIGGKIENTSSFQLSLNGANSGFLPNRVALTKLEDITTVTDPVEGMLIYNTTQNTTAKLVPGLYFFDGSKWVHMHTTHVAATIESRDLAVKVTPTRNSTAHQNPLYSTILTWKDPDNLSLAASNTITLPETGSYAFSFRIYIQQSANGPNRSVFYLWAMKSTSTNPGDILDAAELNIPIFNEATSRFVTYTVTMSASGNAGDKISFRLGSPMTSSWPSGDFIANPKTLAGQVPIPNRTSMIFWKL